MLPEPSAPASTPSHLRFATTPVKQSDDETRGLLMSASRTNSEAYRALLTDLSNDFRKYFASQRIDEPRTEALVQETLRSIHSRRATYVVGSSLTAWAFAIAKYRLDESVRLERSRRFKTDLSSILQFLRRRLIQLGASDVER